MVTVEGICNVRTERDEQPTTWCVRGWCAVPLSRICYTVTRERLVGSSYRASCAMHRGSCMELGSMQNYMRIACTMINVPQCVVSM